MPSSNTHPQASTAVSATPIGLRKRGKTPTKIHLLKLAKAAGGFDTKREARETLQIAGFVTTATAVESLLTAAADIAAARSNRKQRVILHRLGHIPKATGSTQVPAQQPVRLPTGKPMARLNAVRVKSVTLAAHSLLRHGASGGHTTRVAFALDASNVNYVVTMDQNRDTYAGSYKGWTANEDHHVITIPQDWRLRVQRKGLAGLGGMMTLDAHALMPDGDVNLYAATWARQGRGYDVHVDHGYIAMLEGEHFHAETAQAAIKGVRRKVKSIGAPPRRVAVSPYALTVEAFVSRYAKRKVMVSVRDARESGSCDFGIRSWCAFVGLDYNAGQAPLELVLNGFRMRPQEEVRRAVLYALRRHRAQRRAKVI